MERLNRLARIILPGTLFLFLMLVYLLTLAPGLSWANFGADGGDFITAAATGGVAHPTGYPLYLLFARLFQFLPMGSLAFRTNLMSAIFTASAAVWVYILVARALSPTQPHKYWLAGLASGIAFGLSPLIWSQAVITEVYGLHSLLVVILLFLSINPSFGSGNPGMPSPDGETEIHGSKVDAIPSKHFSMYSAKKLTINLLGLLFGLAMGNHITTILLLPVVLSKSVYQIPSPPQEKHKRNRWQVDSRSLLRIILWMAIGFMIYLVLPLRALHRPPINWGNPVVWKGFEWLVSGKLYQGQYFGLTLSSIFQRVQTTLALFLEQFGVSGLIIGFIGLIFYFRPTRLYFCTLWIVIGSAAFSIIYGTTDSFLYLIPAFLCFAIWIGMGLGGMIDAYSHRFRIIGYLISAVLIFTLLNLAMNHFPQVDASQDQRAEIFGSDVLRLAPAHAIVFAKGDRAVFSLWYFQLALKERPDLAIIASDLLQFDWYENMLHSTYIDLKIPVSFPFPESIVVANLERPVCYVQYVHSTEITCLPARNPLAP